MTFDELKAKYHYLSSEKESDWHHHAKGGGWVKNTAWVGGDARVGGNASVGGDAWTTSPLFIRGSKWSCGMKSKTLFYIGCETHTLAEWKKQYQAIAKKHGASDLAKEYKLYIDLAAKLYPVKKP